MEQILESLSVLVIPPWRDETAMTVWCVFLAVAGTVIYLTLRRLTLGRTLRALINGGCTDPRSAKEAGALPGASKRALESRDRLIEKVKEEGAPTRYYLPDSHLKKAQYFMKASGTGFPPKKGAVLYEGLRHQAVPLIFRSAGRVSYYGTCLLLPALRSKTYGKPESLWDVRKKELL